MLSAIFDVVLANAVMVTLLAMAVAVVAHICRRPAIMHTLWLLVILKFITPPLVSLPVPEIPWQISSQAETDIETALAPEIPLQTGPAYDTDFADNFVVVASGPQIETVAHPTAVAGRPNEVPWLILSLWAVGTATYLLLLLRRMWRFRRFAQFTAAAPDSWQLEAQQIAAKLRIDQSPQIRTITARISPLLWHSGGQVVILLPAELLSRLSDDQVRSILTHELAHLRRRDHWTRRLMALVTAVYWWHPVLWWARRGLLQAEEQCCDALVVGTFPERSRDYAAALLQTIDFLSGARPPLPASAMAFGQGRILKRRFEMILDKGVSAKMTWKMRSLIWAAGFAVLACSPFVAAEVKPADPPKPKVIDASAAAYDKVAPAVRKSKPGNQSKIYSGKKTIYHVKCRIIERRQSKPDKLIEPQLALYAGKKGSLRIGGEQPIQIPQSKGTSSIELVDIGNSLELRVLEGEGDMVTVHAVIESTPGVTTGKHRDPENSGKIAREYTHVHTHKLRVVESIRLGGTVAIPLDGSTNLKTAKHVVEIMVRRLGRAQPGNEDEAVIIMPSPDDNAPSKQQIRSALEKLIQEKEQGNVSLHSKSAIKNLRVTVERTVDKTGPAKNYPLVGLAKQKQLHYKCTANFDFVRTSDWPVPLTHKEARQEVFYIDQDSLIRADAEKK